MNRNLNKTHKTDKLLQHTTSSSDSTVTVGHNMTCINSTHNNNNYKVLFKALILIVFFVLLLLSLIPVIGGQGSSLPSLPNPPGGGGSKLSRCEQCQLLTDSFQAGVERTSRGKHEGGDSHWEESRLGSYANSEIRLTEIQELLCHELSAGKDQCHHLAEEYEPQIENWWFSKRQASDSQSLYDYLCMGQMKACCPTGHYGPQCQPCPGYPDRVCNTRGYCEGNGSREGTGKCVCQPAYDGAHCNTCAKDHWLNGTTAEGLVVCEPCDKSCADRCRSGGAKGCLVCGTGYIWDGDYGCVDVDECADMGVNPCESNAFCINTEGSFYCYRKCLLSVSYQCSRGTAGTPRLGREGVSPELWHKCRDFQRVFSRLKTHKRRKF